MGKITYYNRKGYPDDVNTGGKGLVPAQIDDNFYNLKSADVKGAAWDEKKGEVVITFNDGTSISTGKLNPYYMDYNAETNTLTGKTASGTTFTIAPGILTDDTLTGDNTGLNPITISNMYRTGFIRPVKEVILNDKYPTGTFANGDRYILTKSVNYIGRLYTADEVNAIEAYLESINSEWRVATNNDWIKMLNAVEPCVEDRDHENIGEDGRIAGDLLKDSLLWDGYDTYGFKVIPNKGKAVFASFNKEGKGYRLFRTDENQVVYGIDSQDYYSIRLVKSGVYRQYEDIMGQLYGCVKMHSWDGTEDTINIWTKENLDLTELNGKEIGIPVAGDNVETRYYIIEYNTVKDAKGTWDRQLLDEGQSFYCFADDNYYTLIRKDDKLILETCTDMYNKAITTSYYDDVTRELVINFKNNNTIPEIRLDLKKLIKWIVENVDGDETSIGEKIAKAKAEMLSALTEETDARIAADEYLAEAISAETAERNEDIQILSDAIELESAQRLSADTDLFDAIELERAERISADTEMQEASEEAIAEERAERISADTELQQSLEAETAARIAGDEELNNAIEAEKAERLSAETDINAAIETERKTRIASEKLLADDYNAQIANEVKNREEADTRLNTALTSEAATRAAADTAIDNKVVTFKNELDKAIADEATARKAGDEAVEDLVKAEANARTEADNNLQAELDVTNTEVTEHHGKIEQLSSQIESVKQTIDVLNTLIKIAGEITKEDIEALEKTYQELHNEITSAVTDLQGQIDEEREERVNDIADVNTKIDALSGEVAENQQDIVDTYNAVESDIDAAKEEVVTMAESSAQTLDYKIDVVNEALSRAISGIADDVEDLVIPKEVEYDSESNHIYLRMNNGSTTYGFDASVFDKGMLEKVEASGTSLYFYFTGKKEPTVIDLSDAIDEAIAKALAGHVVTDVVYNGESVVDEDGVAVLSGITGKIQDVEVNGESVVDEDGVAHITISGDTGKIQDVEVNGESVVDEDGVAHITISGGTGKIQDVVVNGESVVDEDGVANITISGGEGTVKDVKVNGESVVDEDGVANIDKVDAKTTSNIKVTGKYAGGYTSGDTIPSGTSIETIVKKMLQPDEEAANTEKAIAGAINYIWSKIIEKHPDLGEE